MTRPPASTGRPTQRSSTRDGREAKLTAARAEARRTERRHRALIATAAAVVGLGVVGGATALALGSGDGGSARDVGTALPPWPAPADPAAGIRAAGLDASTMEGTATHFHSHLDILVDGNEVPVAPNIGIDISTGAMSELHSHDASGVLHVESPSTGRTYTLGQVFTEWGVRLDATHLGGLTAGDGARLAAYVDGAKVPGDPADVELRPHRQIALVYGSPEDEVSVPSTYTFAPGE